MNRNEMNCDRLEHHVVDYLEGTLDDGLRSALESHLAQCAACADEVAAVEETWASLGSLPDREPSEALRRRFRGWLEAERAAAAPPSLMERLSAWLPEIAPRRPVLQWALTLAVLVGGALLGGRLGGGNEVGELRDEVASLNQLVAVSLLQQDSASERLRGVSFGRAAAESDDRVLAALLDALAEDPNANVRLAAIDAVRPHIRRGAVRSRLIESLGDERSPLVQLSLVDLLIDADGPESRRAIENLLAAESVDETVRRHARTRLEQST